MPFLDAPDQITTTLTDAGRNAFARALLGEISIKIVGFNVGASGYEDANPVKILPVTSAKASLDAPIFPTTGFKPIESFERPYPYTLIVNCRLSSTEAVSALGELGIYAEIVYSGTLSEIGTTFMFAYANMPMFTKTSRHVNLFRFITQF
jgi:hypothetical protein